MHTNVAVMWPFVRSHGGGATSNATKEKERKNRLCSAGGVGVVGGEGGGGDEGGGGGMGGSGGFLSCPVRTGQFVVCLVEILGGESQYMVNLQHTCTRTLTCSVFFLPRRVRWASCVCRRRRCS
jgi:hypothetical protein